MLVIVGLVVAATVRPGLPAAADGYPVPAPAAFAERGVTEGFYSDFFFGKDPGTWTWPVRLDMLRFMARLRMNRFWYSPKNDRFASGDRWADLYPASFTDSFRAFVTTADALGIQVGFQIRPSLRTGESYASATFLNDLRRKYDQIRALGVRDLILAFDDSALPGTGTAQQGRDHALLANAVRSWYPAAQGNTLRFAPIDYTGTGASEYRTAARAVLEPSVQVMWTGRDVVAPTVSAADATAITASWARRPILVDNAMANDVPVISPMGQVNIAPIAGRDAGLSARLPGFVIQGNRDPGSTELGLAMAGSYLLEPGTYDTGRALVDGVDQFVTHYTAASLDPATRQRLRWAVRDLVEYRFANWQMTKGLPGQTAPIAVKTFRNWVRPNLDRVNAAVAAGNRESTRQLYRDVRDTVRAMNEAPALLGQLTHRTAGTAWRAAAEDMRREVLLFNQDVMANLTTLAAVYRE
jgi:hypothetical protein